MEAARHSRTNGEGKGSTEDMSLRGTSALEQLSQLETACAQLSAASLADCYEFDSQDLATLLGSKDAEETAAALAFLWTDLHQRSRQPEALLHCAYARTAALIASTNTWANPRSNIHLLCERVFDALASRTSQTSAHHPLSLLLADVMATTVKCLQNRGGLDWLTLANSCCAIWPIMTRQLFAFLSTDTHQWQSAFEYVCVVAYPTPDHPWITRPFLPWWFYEAHETLKWEEQSCDVLAQLLSPLQIEARLRGISESEAIIAPQHLNVAAIVDEIVDLQLESDFPKRVKILLRHLASGDKVPFWDDEVGAVR
jgi:hypothetical protein